MNSFVRTVAFGLAAMFLVLLTAGVTAGLALRKSGQLDPAALRDLVLTPEERAWLAAKHGRPDEPAEATPRGEREEEVLARVAEMANADQASRLVADLRRQKQTLDERQAWLDQQEADMRLARADLERIKGQLDQRLRQVQEESARQQAKHKAWAEAALAEEGRVDAIKRVELERAREQVKIFESMKDGAWTSLRRFPPREIARYLHLMDPKRAAKVLAAAEADKENPDVTIAIHRAYLRLDIDQMTGDQVRHLARLYSFLPPEGIATALRNATVDEAAEVLAALEEPKLLADVLALVRGEDPKREHDIQAALARMAPTLPK